MVIQMIKLPFYCLLVLLLLPLNSVAELQPDFEREKRLEEQVVDIIFDGEPVFLNAGNRKFLALHMETDQEPEKGAVIILHGRGYHPDWKNVANPLRIGLTEKGWDTLSLQMPVLEKDATYYDYVPVFPYAHPRIEAAIRFLREKGVKRVVLIAHSCSVHMSMSWIDDTGGKGIDAYVGIGMGAVDYKQKMKKPLPLDKLKVPILDIYGAKDFPAVHRYAYRRLMSSEKGGNPLSKQVVVPEADHYFTEMGKPLLEEISKWLDTLGAVDK
ncbi:MAG: alpha/beta hydrolase family protein [Gammaproteobacteria bacterium]|nr:alpha/beta hydrolase family protein [Gammaproteobacteria bacterium]